MAAFPAVVSVARLRSPARLASPVAAAAAAVWVVAGLVDSLSTVLMMPRGFAEGNPLAAAAMLAVSPWAVCLLAFLVSLGFAALALCAAPGLYGSTVLCTVAALGLAKAYVAFNNVWIFAGHAPWPFLS